MFDLKVVIYIYLSFSLVSSDNEPQDVVLPNRQIVMFEPGGLIRMGCLLESNHLAQFVWSKRDTNGTNEQPLVADSRVQMFERGIEIESSRASDAGDYICRTNSSKTNRVEDALIPARLVPQFGELGVQLTHLGNSSLVYEGQRVEMLCGPSDRLIRVFSGWYRSAANSSERHEAIHRREFYLSRQKDVEPNMYVIDLGNYTTKLVIVSASLQDRQYYTCHIRGPTITYEPRFKSVYLRVRPRTLIYWPLAGIAFEVLAMLLLLLLVKRD